MECPNCGQIGRQIGLGQTYECPACGAVFVQSVRQPVVSVGTDAATEAELADVTRLAQIRQRAAEERRRREEDEPTAESEGRARSRRSCWPAVAAVVVLIAAATGVYLSGVLAPRPAIASGDGDLRGLAEKGEAGAQFALGLLYDFGFQGSVRDPDEAFVWYVKAAAAGDIDAQYFLGNWYRTYAARRDGAEAVYWISMAAEQGHRSAQATLADLYLAGEGVGRDPEQASAWYARAAEQGSAAAHCGLARLYAGAETGHRRDPPAAAMHEYVAKVLGRDCGLSGHGASAALANWTAEEGVKRGKEVVAKGFPHRPLR